MSREGTPVHLAKSELGKKFGLLDEAEQIRYVQKIGPKYFPAFRALELEDNHDRLLVEECTTLVFRALKRIYQQSGDTMCALNNILAASKSFDPNASAESITVGMLFATEFATLIPTWNASPENNTLNLNLQTSARLLGFDNLRPAWQRELRIRAPIPKTASATRREQVRPAQLVFETAAETYTAQAIVGEGNAARVFRVTDAAGQVWALKCLKPDQATPTRTKRFLNELEFCRRSTHPNVVRVLDQGFVTDGGKKCPFYIMRYYAQTLRTVIQKGIPHHKIMPLFSLILDGVEAAHLNQVWHRDLKPENVLCEANGESPVVADFGIAHFAEEQLHTLVETRAHDRLANFLYSAPEQRVPGSSVDHRADIFALGLMLNEMFTGHVPQGSGFIRIGQVATGFAYADEIIDRMVRQSPQDRPQSVEELKRTLIAKGNEFISRQRLDKLQQTVVPVETVTEAFALKRVGVDVRGSSIIVHLSEEPPGDWLRLFAGQPVRAFVAGAEPINWRFDKKEASASLHPQRLESEARSVLNHFDNYLETANSSYLQILKNRARQREETLRRDLQTEVEGEQRRLRILRKLAD